MPLVGTVKAAVDDVIHFLLRSYNPIQHNLTIWKPLITSYPVKHDLSSFMEGIELNAKVINVFASLLALRYYFEG